MEELLARIRAANPAAAMEVERRIQETLVLLGINPLSGTRARLANPNLRGLHYATVRFYPQFVILYLPIPDGVEVLHIVRGRRILNRVVADD